jgi:hypothetical protein
MKTVVALGLFATVSLLFASAGAHPAASQAQGAAPRFRAEPVIGVETPQDEVWDSYLAPPSREEIPLKRGEGDSHDAGDMALG